jgi:2-polyprenyl-3-methyl-5-hydroxy-6-metoxy-1,4-benzoquinol methylase
MGQLVSNSPFFVVGPPARIGEANGEIVEFICSGALGEILDLGGGRGAYAHALTAHGFKVTVAEKNTASLEEARRNGIPVLDVNEVALAELAGKFDTVILIEVLEHIPDPRSFLADAIRIARKRVLLTVPCNDDFRELFSRGITYNHIAVSDHLNQFTSNEIAELVLSLGHTARIHTGAYLFPDAILPLLRDVCKGSLAGRLGIYFLRAANRIGLLPKRYPSRIFVEIRLEL